MREIHSGPQETPVQEEVSLYRDEETHLRKSSYDIFTELQEMPQKFVWPRKLGKEFKGKVYEYLQEFFDVMNLASQDDPRAFERYFNERRRFLHKFTSEVKRKQRYRLLRDFAEKLAILPDLFPEVRGVLILEACDLYYLLCEEDKMLAGAWGGLWWKEVIPENYPPEEREFVWQAIVLQMSAIFRNLRKSEIELVPDRFIIQENLKKLNLPKPAKSIEELLEEAYYHQRYMISPNGAEVHLRNAGDLETMIVKQSKDVVIAKAITTMGEALVIIDLDRAEPISPEVTARQEPNLANILAEVYRDLVIAIEVPGPPRKRREPSAVTPIEERELPKHTWIYIPRKIRVKGKETEAPIRTPYKGPRRPPQTHEVDPHPRRGNMTEKQRKALEEYREQTGIDLFRLYRPGHTIVRPHTRGGKPGDIKELPTFIKKRIETRLVEKANHPNS